MADATVVLAHSARPKAAPLEPSDPEQLGPYRLLGRLGSGGMGVVLLGERPGGELAAVKVVRPELAGQPQFRSRFAREVATASRVRGRFTAHILHSDLQAAQQWVATQYVPGPTLAEHVEEHGRVSPDQARMFAAGLAEALYTIHAAGMVHRDLKPSNVILSPEGPKVIDFGISRAADDTSLTQTGAISGSLAWMAPEQVTGADVGQPADVFSWGLVAGYAALGRHPYGTGGAAALGYRMVHQRPDLDGLAQPLQNAVAAALLVNPNARKQPSELIGMLTWGPTGLDPAGTMLMAPPTAIVPIPHTQAPMAVAGAPRRRHRRLIAATMVVAAAATSAFSAGAMLTNTRQPTTAQTTTGTPDPPTAEASTTTARVSDASQTGAKSFTSTCTWEGRSWDDIYSGYYDTFEASCSDGTRLKLTHDNSAAGARYSMTGELAGRTLQLALQNDGQTPETWDGVETWTGTFDGVPVHLDVGSASDAFQVLPGSSIGSGQVQCTGPALRYIGFQETSADNPSTVTGSYTGDPRVSLAEAGAICSLAAAELPARGFTGYAYE